MSFSEERVLEVLRKVKYPGKDQNIVEMGLVSNIWSEGKKLGFSILFDRSNDPVIPSVRKACVKALKKYLDPKVEIEGNIEVNARQVVESRRILPGVENIIAVASGKGGVGKSTVAVNLAVAAARKGLKVGLIDADIFGPSIPKMLNAESRRPAVEMVDGKEMLVPVESYGIQLLSIGFFVDPEDAVVWRGPMATNALRQFISQTSWGELDYIFIDLPPGTSDIHLTMVQEVPVTGAVIVTTPQQVALADALKGVNMFRSDKINVPVLGLVENMAWFTPAELPENRYYLFGRDGGIRLAEKLKIPLLGQIPIVQSICEGGDAGKPAVLEPDTVIAKAFEDLAVNVIRETDRRNAELPPTRILEIKKM
jgi:ATP-binding protein involved in chromosome partitioning